MLNNPTEDISGVMNDTIHTDLPGYQTTKISKLAEEMFQIHLRTGKDQELY